MKKFSKIFSVLLSVVLVLSIFCFPANAKIAGASLEWSIKLEKVTTAGEVVDAEGNDAATLGNIYKVVVSQNSTAPINAMQVGVAYDADLFDVCYGDDTGNYLTYPCGEENGYSTAHKMLGTLADAEAYSSTGVPGQTSGPKIKAYGPSNASANTTFVNEALANTDERHTNGIKWAYTDLGDAAPANPGIFIVKYALSNANAKGIILPNGQEDLAEVYLMLKEGKTDADVNGTEMRMTLTTYSACSNPTMFGELPGWMKTSVPDTIENELTHNGAKYVYESAPVPAGPAVAKSAGQIKMTATSATEVDPAFQLRLISKITAADWDANFANTAVDGATANYITKVGMVAYTGAAGDYNLDDAKAAIAAGASNGNYYYGETNYIKHAEGGDATFGTILKCTHGSDKLQNDPICLGFVTYVDAAGQTQTIYYAETYTAPIVSNYDTLAKTYAQNYWGK